MVDHWKVSDDKLTYTFTLRDGLKWHDGQPVRAVDCVASIERWGKRDPFGQKMMEAVGEIKPIDDKSFTINLKTPFPLLLNALGKLSSNVPFMMPERLAKTDPFKQIPEAIGSGPFKFVKVGMGARQQGGFCQKHRICAAQRAAELCLGRQGGQGRPRRMALYSRLRDRVGGAERRRSRLVRAAADRSVAGLRRQPRRRRRDRRSARQPGHPALQPCAAAVRQSEAAPGGAEPRRPKGLHAGRRRRPEILENLRRPVRLRHAVRDQCRRRGAAERPEPGQGESS